MSVLSRKTQDELRAYADGVNAWIARNELPGQYASVQVTEVEPWSVVDSLLTLKLVAFSLSFDLDIDRTTAVQAYDAAGLDGRTAVFGDLSPFAPFNQASPVIDATRRPVKAGTPHVTARTGESRVSERRRPDGGRLPGAGQAGPDDRRGAQPRRRSRVELVGHRRAAHRERAADPGQRPAPRPGQPGAVLPDRARGWRLRHPRRQHPGLAVRHPRPEPGHRVRRDARTSWT